VLDRVAAEPISNLLDSAQKTFPQVKQAHAGFDQEAEPGKT
jgi:hypothetical protein